jgi:hypothetical protein
LSRKPSEDPGKHGRVVKAPRASSRWRKRRTEALPIDLAEEVEHW